MFRAALILAIFLLTLLPACASEPVGDPVKLVVQPKGLSTPALRHSLLPDLKDTKPGNAAFLYYRSFSPEWIAFMYRDPQFRVKVDEWVKKPLADLPKLKEELSFLNSKQLAELDLAARREYCDWELTARAREEGMALLLPDLQAFRDLAYVLALRARVQIGEGQFDKATHTLQTGFAMSRHVADAPILLNELVGIAMAQVMANQVEEMIQQPNAPNLYWGLTVLPRPFVDFRKALHGEKFFVVDSLFPELMRNPMMPLTAEQIDTMLDRCVQLAKSEMFEEEERKDKSDKEIKGLMVARMKTAHPTAKKYLADHDWPPAQVDKLPVLQAVLLYSILNYQAHMDDMMKWGYVAYAEAAPYLPATDQALKDLKAKGEEGLPLTTTLVPAFPKVLEAGARIDRRIAALRVIEALRLYAATHDGNFPAKLADIKEVPLPRDPVTGKPFEYDLKDGKARLWSPPLTGPKNPPYTLHYEIMLKK